MPNPKLHEDTKALWKKLNDIAKKHFGEFGFSTLSEEEMQEALDIYLWPTKTNLKLKRKRHV